MATLDWLHFPAQAPHEQMQFVGLAICPTSADRLHCGVLYRATDESVRLLHLAFHHLLQDESPSPAYAWVQLRLPVLRLEAIAGFCRLLWRRHRDGRIPYALRFRETRFSPSGDLLLGHSEHGLTCATFILALLRATGVELVAIEEWEARPDDARLHDAVIALLEQRQAETVHIAAVRAERGCVRFRPEEVVGACSSDQLPVGFENAQRLGQQVVAALIWAPATP